MFITTFYSFKGGVGRTMALANIAAHLAENGKRVLVVDFDLEAPGLSSLFPSDSPTPGILEFVQEYRSTGSTPDVRDHCYEHLLSNGNALWVMPASMSDGDHTAALATIGWQDLYTRGHGYLMIEDLKKQWDALLQVDYVLIDSRTGHSDVEGICTRQLPDALVTLFSPNSQNLEGVTEVTHRVREHCAENDKTIHQLFVASNVPDLDDEHDVLANIFSQFKTSIAYASLDATIHHYPSLLLLRDPLFVISRPKTRLAREYRELADKIRMGNAADEAGVLAVLNHELSGRMVRGRSGRSRRDILDKVYQYHANNPEILYKLSYWTERRGENEQTLLLLDRAIELGYEAPDVYVRRAQLYGESNGTADIVRQDVLTALQSRKLSLPDLIKCIQLNQRLELDILNELAISPAVRSLDVFDFTHLIEELSFSRNALLMALRALGEYEPRLDEINTKYLASQKSLVLIGLGRYAEAMRTISPSRPAKGESEQSIFNYAMAEWAYSESAPLDLFRFVVEDATPPSSGGVNYDQCLAIACAMVGSRDDAIAYIESALNQQSDTFRPAFSCWSYMQQSGAALRNELLEVKQFIDDKSIRPAFMQADDLFEVEAN